ncbi:hypothetical protein [Actinacidiphila bryophytorum]|uniref:hypothetical protein n=1 Tax=Actinacidiphila bryophytorum TaxID=1436133 RepID=UPI0021769AFF|nr:hypothetical protein [Actinacidiphila bryophytorum]UWE12603.1 hypothetical protein NYE86_30580 [Actinacidiphila bryophytorum]
MSRPRPRTPGRAAAAAAVLLAVLTAGCGIRTTSVPVDAGPAPSRVSCAVPEPENSPGVTDAQVVQVYLVCGMQTTPVPRTVQVRARAAGRTEQVRELVAQLQRSVLGAEAKAGFATAVPGTLEVEGPAPGDPVDALRLGQPIEDLPSFALAQIVCTVAGSALASPGHSVVLGGPEAGSKVRRYTCTPDLRTRPQAADTAGTEVS